jgi:hypothetical protein
LKIRHVANFLRVVNLHENETEVKKTFKFQPILENTYQNYHELKKFCLDTKILKLKINNFEFTKFGEEILKNFEGNYLNEKQEELFIDECFLKGNFSNIVLPLLAQFREENLQLWFPTNEIYEICKDPKILPMLDEINLLEKKGTKIFVGKKFTDKIVKLTVGFPKEPISQQEIDNSLKNKKKIGKLGEQIVLEFEQERLSKKGFEQESHNIKQISEDFANAGYDIRSFNGNSDNLIHDRFIEVKSSTGSKFSIHWTDNEIKVAKKYPNNYWIYFIPKIDLVKQSSDEPILIPNPIKNIFKNNDYDKKIESLHITKN